MTMFGQQAGFGIKFDAHGNVLVVIRITAMGGFVVVDEPWIAFGSLSDARTFFQMGMDFCDKNEVKVPQVFEEALKEEQNGE